MRCTIVLDLESSMSSTEVDEWVNEVLNEAREHLVDNEKVNLVSITEVPS